EPAHRLELGRLFDGRPGLPAFRTALGVDTASACERARQGEYAVQLLLDRGGWPRIDEGHGHSPIWARFDEPAVARQYVRGHGLRLQVGMGDGTGAPGTAAR